MNEPHGRVVEVQGTWLENLGARQLLDAVVHHLHEPSRGMELAIDPRWGPYATRRDLGLLQVVPRAGPGDRVLVSATAAARRLAPTAVARLLDGYGLVVRSDVGGLVDASGFALSDQWGPRKAAQRWNVVRSYAARGRPVVLLPQAMGPFRDPRTARYAREVLTAADAVWVRDRRSLEHAQELVGGDARVRLAPDVTIIEPGEAAGGSAAGVIVVPNGRLVDRGGWTREDYVEALVSAARPGRARGHSVEVLLHTSEPSDRELARILASELGCAVVEQRDPRVVKGRLAAAELVIGSRYHALLGALSHGVPAIALGWSHKYEALYEDFGLPELGVAVATADAHGLAGLVGDVLDDAAGVRRRLATAMPSLRAAVEDVWTTTRAVLAGSGASGAAASRDPRDPRDLGDVEHALERDAGPLGRVLVNGNLVDDLAVHE